MYYLIKKTGVTVGKSVDDINKKLNVLTEESEYYCNGHDFICNMTDNDFEFVQDKERMSDILFGNFFKKDNSVKLLLVANIIINFIIFVKI